MSEFNTIADLFAADRQPTRPLEPIQKVDQTDQIERDIGEFYETPSARNVLEETTNIVTNRGDPHRFRYVHATFGSGKSHLLKLIGVATGEIDGLENAAHKLANETTAFKSFREALDDSYIDHLQPLLMNLLDRDRQEATLPLLIYEELGRRRQYPTERPWLLEFCWRLDIEHGIWESVRETEYEGLTLEDAVDRPASLRAWLREVVPGVENAAAAGFESGDDVTEAIESAQATVDADSFDPDDLVERLTRTRDHLTTSEATYEFLIGLDEIAIYVGDQQRRYFEVVETIEALFEGLNAPILATGQWPMRDMHKEFVGDVDDDAWYTNEVQLEGADTETIVRKRWLQKSNAGKNHIDDSLLSEAPSLEPPLTESAEITDHDDPSEAYPFRDRDLWLLRATMQGLIEGDREADRDYVQGRALLVRVRSLFDTHGWATREPGELVSWDVIYDVLHADTALIPEWAHELVERVANTVGDTLAVRTTKALFLLSQVDEVPRTADTIARLLADTVTVDLEALATAVGDQLEELADKNLVREDVDTEPKEYTILSEADIHFWQQVQEAAAEVPHPQFRTNVRQYLQDAGSERLPSDDTTTRRAVGDYGNIPYTVRYTIDTALPNTPTERYDAIVIRLLAGGDEAVEHDRTDWQDTHSAPSGVEDVLLTVNLPKGIRRQIRQLIGMKQVLDSMADPDPKLRLDRQTKEEEVEDEIADRLENAQLYLPTRSERYGTYLESFDAAIASQVDEKFPNRKSIDTQIQQGDLQDLIDFFDGDGAWPLTDDDADELGVKTVPRTIDDGWVTEFLDVFAEEDRVSGERILETISGRRGEFLGTPMNALHGLLFVLVADGKIAVRSGGDRLTEISTIASHLTRKGALADAIIDFDPQPPTEGLEDVYAALLGESPDTDEAAVLVSEIGSWAAENSSMIRTVITRTNMVFGSGVSLAALDDALEPAFSGSDLTPDQLSHQQIVTQAELFETVQPLFVETDGAELWEEFKTTYETVVELYPTATEVKQMQPYATGTTVPTKDQLESQIESAHTLRVERLQHLYRLLAGTQTQTDDLDELRREVTNELCDAETISAIDTISERFESCTFDLLQERIETAESHDDPLSEAELAGAELLAEAETITNAKALLNTKEDGDSLYEQMQSVAEKLQEEHEDSFPAKELQRALDGTAIPDPARAEQLLSTGRSLLDDDTTTDEKDDLDELWQDVRAYGDGTIVVIDREDNL